MTHNELVKQVRRRMKERGLTSPELHKTLCGRVSKQTVYNFVKHGRVIKSDTLLLVLHQLGLTIRVGRT
jgi:hypothetical protein